MRILIKGTAVQLTPAIEDYIQKRIGGLEKYLKRLDSPAVEARVEVGKISGHHKKGDIFRAEINLKLPGRLLRAEEESDDLFAAIDLVHDEMKREIVSFKAKKIESRQRKTRLSRREQKSAVF